MNKKPLGHRAYGSIPHLIGSKRGPGDVGCDEGMHRILTEKARDNRDLIIVQEKLDGSNVAVAKIDGEIVALTRAGYTAETSPHEQHRYFAKWVTLNHKRFDELLQERERISGEWLLQAHGTRYRLRHEPFVAFDLWNAENKRMVYADMIARTSNFDFIPANLLHMGGPLPIEIALSMLHGGHGAIDTLEGAVWRVERKGVVDFLAKYVNSQFTPGTFMFMEPPIWNTYTRKKNDTLGVVQSMAQEQRRVALGGN